MSLFRRYEMLCLGLSLAFVGCDRPATDPLTETASAAAKEPATSVSTDPPDKAPDPIKELNARLESMGAKVVAEPSGEADGPDGKSYESLARELAELRAEVKRLQETVDLTVSYVVGDLQEENRRLRQEVAHAYGAGPDRSEDQTNASQPLPADPKAPVDIESGIPGATGPLEGSEYLVVKEWGRPPEEVESLGTQVPSLKGMICVAAANMTDAEYSDLGRQIREEFDVYDNIVVEVFTNEGAAKAFAENNKRSATYNVLTIQKDGASGSDYILLHRNGVSVDVPR